MYQNLLGMMPSIQYTDSILVYQNVAGVPNVKTVMKMTKNDPSVLVFSSVYFYISTWAFERTDY